jgi:hypothetical protein
MRGRDQLDGAVNRRQERDDFPVKFPSSRHCWVTTTSLSLALATLRSPHFGNGHGAVSTVASSVTAV